MFRDWPSDDLLPPPAAIQLMDHFKGGRLRGTLCREFSLCDCMPRGLLENCELVPVEVEIRCRF